MTLSEKIAVIGGGVAGIATVAALRARGLQCVAYEKQRGPGGLWYNNYPGAKNQSGAELYEFPDKKYPEAIRSSGRDVTAREVYTYLEEFIQEQDIAECFQFGVEIANITREADDKWTLHFKDSTTETFSFVIMCCGLYSTEPNFIDLPGRDAFEKTGGVVIHTSQRKNDSEFKGKNVVVVGNGKSAMDAALAAGRVAKETEGAPPIQLVRRSQWYFPLYLMGFIHFKYAFLSRFGGSILPRYCFNDSFLSKLLHGITAPLKFVLWRMIEIMFLCQYRLPWEVLPKLGTLDKDALSASSLAVREEDLRPYRAGEVHQRLGTIDRLEPGKVILSDGSALKADMIILGTGWRSGLRFLDEDTVRPLLDFDLDGLWLYRHILPPKTKGLAFVESNCSTFTNPNTSLIQAAWLGDLLVGKRGWPSEEEMLENAEKEKAFKRALFPWCAQRGAAVVAFLQHYHDLLLNDMGIDPMRYGGPLGTFCNWMLPVVPGDFKGVLLNPDSRETVPKLRPPDTLYGIAVAVMMLLLYRISG